MRIIIGVIHGVWLFMFIMRLIMFGFAMAFYVFFRTMRGRGEDQDLVSSRLLSASNADVNANYINPGLALLYHYGVMLGEVGDVSDIF